MMKFVRENVDLAPYNTFGIHAIADYFATITDTHQLLTLADSKLWEKPKLILGGGSNILFTANYHGLVIHLETKGIDIINETETDILLKVQAGENWHKFVLFCVNNGYGGVENLSLIPGSVGASPMQNIGAYGVEIEQVFESLSAFHISKKEFHTFTHAECQFGYRSSMFKTSKKDEYIITDVTYRLQKEPTINISYGAVQQTLHEMNVDTPTIKDVSNAIICIRQRKLPDPDMLGNSGSFFKNPVITQKQFLNLHAQYPEIPHYIVSSDTVKIPAGWLIEQCGFKGKVIGNTGTYKHQALILVNHGQATGVEIWNFAKSIQTDVQQKFGIRLEPEVNLI